MADIDNASEISAVASTPESSITNTNAANQEIKPAEPSIILFDEESTPIELMSSLIFEDIGGHEIINYLRHDTVDGINLAHNLISNSKAISRTYAPGNIVPKSGTIEETFKNFGIRLDVHQIETSSVNRQDAIYIDQVQVPGSIVIEVTSMEANEQIEVQILNAGSYLDGII